MSFCTYCGAKVADDALFCPNCGASMSKGASSDASHTGGYFHTAPRRDYGESVGVAILSFIIPIVGVIMFFVWRYDKPDFAKVGLVAGIISFALSFLFGILWGGIFLPAFYDGLYSTAAAFAPVLF